LSLFDKKVVGMPLFVTPPSTTMSALVAFV
jgi:hypothetical protein